MVHNPGQLVCSNRFDPIRVVEPVVSDVECRNFQGCVVSVNKRR